jgi:ArsR family transcriptional regulator, arsenate/arsenite/antimonite-responsive transcriptional repressor
VYAAIYFWIVLLEMIGSITNVPTASQAKTARLSKRQMILISKALSDPRRLGILQRIAARKCMGCSALLESVPITPATMSHHLKELEAAGLIDTRREGKFVTATFRRDVWNSYLSKLAQI